MPDRPGRQHHQRRRQPRRRQHEGAAETQPQRQPITERQGRERQRHSAHPGRQPHGGAERQRRRPGTGPTEGHEDRERPDNQRGGRNVRADDARHGHPRRPERVDDRRQRGVRTGANSPPAGRPALGVAVVVTGAVAFINELPGHDEEPRGAQRPEEDAQQLLRQQIAAQVLDRRQQRHEPRHVDEAGIEAPELRQVVGRLAVHREVAHRHCRDGRAPRSTGRRS